MERVLVAAGDTNVGSRPTKLKSDQFSDSLHFLQQMADTVNRLNKRER